jgi:hypothetical protein
MTEVYPNLWVGDENDYELGAEIWNEWRVVLAAKEPFHRDALGYTGRGAPKEHPEYLFAHRENRLILNMVDADDPGYFAVEMIEEALDFIESSLSEGMKVFVCCNKGGSRSPSIALLCMARLGALPKDSFEEAEGAFFDLYEPYNPRPGIREHLRLNWDYYISGRTASLPDSRRNKALPGGPHQ